MNGADSLVQTLIAGGIEVCFTNPGTSEMHLVAALDRQNKIRCVLGLFEGVVTAAADGYARMAGKPACTLLHLGPGFANGLANLHNAWRAHSPIVNLIGQHAISHLQKIHLSIPTSRLLRDRTRIGSEHPSLFLKSGVMRRRLSSPHAHRRDRSRRSSCRQTWHGKRVGRSPRFPAYRRHRFRQPTILTVPRRCCTRDCARPFCYPGMRFTAGDSRLPVVSPPQPMPNC